MGMIGDIFFFMFEKFQWGYDWGYDWGWVSDQTFQIFFFMF
jgi:hypothetical protein